MNHINQGNWKISGSLSPVVFSPAVFSQFMSPSAVRTRQCPHSSPPLTGSPHIRFGWVVAALICVWFAWLGGLNRNPNLKYLILKMHIQNLTAFKISS